MNLVLGFRRSDDTLAIIEQTREAVDDYGRNYHGSDLTMLKPEHIKALQSGKALAWNDGEYCNFVVLEQESEPTIDYFCGACQRSFKGHIRAEVFSDRRIMVKIIAVCPHCSDTIASGLEITPREKKGDDWPTCPEEEEEEREWCCSICGGPAHWGRACPHKVEVPFCE